MKLYCRGEPNDDLLRLIRQNVRTEEMVLGDIHAQVGANGVAAERLVAFMDEYGLDDLSELATVVQDRAERAMREAIAAVSDGEYAGSAGFDGLGEPMELPVRVVVEGDEITVDWSGAPDQLERGGINCTLSYTEAHTAYALKCILTPEVPSNAGCFRPIHVMAPEGSILNCQYPASVNQRTVTGWTCAPAVFGALAEALPEGVQAFTGLPMGAGAYGRDAEGRTFNDHLFQGGGETSTLGIVGRLGGLGARPEAVGYVSDGDGAVAALSAALKLADMRLRGDVLEGDVIVGTHVCHDAPTKPHHPVPFMDSPVDMATMNEKEIDPGMDAVLSIDTTKGNRLVSHRGIAISPPVKEGWILRHTNGLLDIYQSVTGRPPVVLPLTMQDITPYGNGVHHVNSILQPSTATAAPVVGVAITAESVVPGSATGASHETDIALAVRYVIEVAKLFGQGNLAFYDEGEFERLVRLYGSMKGLQGAER